MTNEPLQSGTSTASENAEPLRPAAFRVSLLIMGASGVIAQIILIRELMVAFLGNELVLGIILANWLLLEAAGSFLLGRSIGGRGRAFQPFLLTQLLFSLLLPSAVYISRVFKSIIHLVPGQALGFASILGLSFLIILPAAVPHGALFTFASRLYGSRARGQGSSAATAIGWVYVLETFGSILGGAVLTFILIRRFDSFSIACGVSLINAVITLILVWPKPQRYAGPLAGIRRTLIGLSLVLTFVYALLIASPLAERIHLSSIRTRWGGFELIHSEDSIYGNITVAGRNGQRTFFTDGVPAATVPVPDIASIEDFAHFPLLLHPSPRSVLIVSGGAGGMIREVLKHPVRRIDYVELDPLLLTLIERHGSPLTVRELSDQRVEIHHTDGRLFLTRTEQRFDLVFIGLDFPQELQTNRLYSREFFATAREKMNPNGMIALSLPGSLIYMGEELRNLNGSILDTLESVFAHVRVIPGDTNLYIASDSHDLATTGAEQIIRRIEARGIRTELVSAPYIEYRLQPQWLDVYNQAVKPLPRHINSDFHPLAVFYSLSYWNALFSPYLEGIFARTETIRLSTIALLVGAASLLLAALFFLGPGRSGAPLAYAIATTGFCGMVFDLAVVFTFQTLFGYLYYQIGLLVTVFMAGAASGSLWATRRLDRMTRAAPVFLISELCLAVFAVLLPVVFTIPAPFLDLPLVYVLLHLLFLLMSFTSGILTGVQFPLATRLHLRRFTGSGWPVRDQDFGTDKRDPARTAGLLYASDLLGGYFGGLIGGVLLLPILGLRNSCFILAMIKAGSLLLNLLYTPYTAFRGGRG